MSTEYLSLGKVAVGVVISLEDDTGDPANKNRVKVRIPMIHGPMKQSDLPSEWSNSTWVDDDGLPWVPICFPLGTASPDKSLLKEKEIVYLLYTDRDNKYPVIIGTAARLVEE